MAHAKRQFYVEEENTIYYMVRFFKNRKPQFMILFLLYYLNHLLLLESVDPEQNEQDKVYGRNFINENYAVDSIVDREDISKLQINNEWFGCDSVPFEKEMTLVTDTNMLERISFENVLGNIESSEPSNINQEKSTICKKQKSSSKKEDNEIEVEPESEKEELYENMEILDFEEIIKKGKRALPNNFFLGNEYTTFKEASRYFYDKIKKIVEYNYILCLSEKNLKEIVDGILDISKENEMLKELQCIFNGLMRLIYHFSLTSKDAVELKDVYSVTIKKSKCPLRRMFCCLDRSTNMFLSLDKCKNPIDFLDSSEFLKVYMILILIFTNSKVGHEKSQLQRKLYRKKNVYDKIPSVEKVFITYVTRNFNAFNKFMINDVEYKVNAFYDIMKIVLALSPSDSNTCASQECQAGMENIQTIFYEYNARLGDIHTLVRNIDDMNKPFFLYKYKLAKEHGSVNFLQQIREAVNVALHRVKCSIKDKCDNDTDLIRLLYYSFGELLIKRLTIDVKENTDAALIVDQLMIFIQMFEKMITAVELLNLSEARSTSVNINEDEKKELLYLVMFHCQLHLIRCLLTHVDTTLQRLFVCFEKYISNPKNYVSPSFKSEMVAHYVQALDFINLGLSVLAIFKKNAGTLKRVSIVFDLIHSINDKVLEMRSILEDIRRKDIHTINDKIEKGDLLFKDLNELYSELFIQAKDL